MQSIKSVRISGGGGGHQERLFKADIWMGHMEELGGLSPASGMRKQNLFYKGCWGSIRL